jgi:V8-like Glu-specific endopeptidase
MKRISVVVGILLMGVLTCGVASAKTSGLPTIVNSDLAATEAFWTADRLAAAQPMQLPTASNVPWSSEIESAPSSQVSAPSATPTLRLAPNSAQLFTPANRQEESVEPEAFGTIGFRYTSSRLVTDAVASLGGETRFPYAMTGQLFFNEGNSLFVCSATVQRIGVITTAGHCVSDGNGHFFSNWRFIPATRLGSAPFGTWIWKQVITTTTWHFGGGGVPNAQDVAVIALFPNSKGVKIGSLTGFAGFNIPDLYAGQHVTTIGYPCNLDSCAKDHRNDAQVFGGSNNTDIIGTDMRGGASGGGWLINYGEYAVGQPAGASDSTLLSLVAVTSYGPVAVPPMYLGASILDRRYVQCVPLNTCAPRPSAILNAVCVNNPGFC